VKQHPPPLQGNITGLVLAGGRGSRMLGADKGLVDWLGKPLACHALERLRPQVGAVAINANRNLPVYQGWDVPVWPDADERFPGPLAGLLAGLERCATDWLVTVPCDSPLFPADLVAVLCRAVADTGSPIAMAATERPGGIDPQPVFLLAHRSLRLPLAQAIGQDERRVRRWAESQGCVMAVFSDAGAFANANTAEDLAALNAGRPSLQGVPASPSILRR
jgi:molybdopterin-guanine dinucleotide biosynthesis protein A